FSSLGSATASPYSSTAFRLLSLGRLRAANFSTCFLAIPAERRSSTVMRSWSCKKSPAAPSTLAVPTTSPVSTLTKRAVKRPDEGVAALAARPDDPRLQRQRRAVGHVELQHQRRPGLQVPVHAQPQPPAADLIGEGDGQLGHRRVVDPQLLLRPRVRARRLP